jgi:hypothetical protein
MKQLLLAIAGVILAAFAFSAPAEAKVTAQPCWVGIAPGEVCPPPPGVQGKFTSTPEFKRDCTWLPFPVGKVAQPVVFFTKTSDARCLGARWKVDCPICTDWIHGKRGPVHGPAANAVIALRLVDNLSGISVPRDSIARIKGDAGWCDFGRSAPDSSHRFDERPW